MGQHDVHPAPGGQGYLLNLQSELLDIAETVVVAPLIRASEAPSKIAPRLNPRFRVLGEETVLFPQSVATVPRSILGAPVANIGSEATAITAALDMVFQGF